MPVNSFSYAYKVRFTTRDDGLAEIPVCFNGFLPIFSMTPCTLGNMKNERKQMTGINIWDHANFYMSLKGPKAHIKPER